MTPERPSGPLDLRFSVGPFPVAVDPFFWLMMVVFGSSAAQLGGHFVAGWVLVAFVSILVHELGHAIAIRAFGGSASIRLYGFGGLTFPDRAFPRGPSIIVSLAGPFAGFGLFALCWVADAAWERTDGLVAFMLEQARWVNLVWGLVNLLPVLPLDGGHVLSEALGPKRLRSAVLIGGFVGVLAAGYFFRAEQLYAGILFAFLALRNFMASSQLAETEKGASFARPDAAGGFVPQAAARAWQLLRQGDRREARRIAEFALQSASGMVKNDLLDVLAWLDLADGEVAKARARMEATAPRNAVRALTQALVLEELGRFEDAAPFARAAFLEEPSDTTAALAGRVLLKVGATEEAHRIVSGHSWEKTAVRDSLAAEIALRQSDYPLAAQLAEAAFVATKEPKDAYHAAWATAVSGDVARAALWLKHALDNGFDDLADLERNTTLAPVVALPEVAEKLRATRR